MTATVPHARLRTPTGPVEIPMLGLGTWQSVGEECYRAVRAALDVGYRHVDTATIYGNEDVVGRALRDSGVPREEVFVTTKLRPQDGAHADMALERSLRALGVDHLDLWLIHWPPDGDAGVAAWERFLAAQEAGKVRAVGVSNYSPELIDELDRATGSSPALDQIPWSPADYDPALVGALRARDVVLEGYSPFKRTDMNADALRQIAGAHAATPQQVVLRWHLQHGFVAIPKSSDPERITANFDVMGFELSAAEMRRLDALGGR